MEVPLLPEPAAAKLRDGSGSCDPVVTISFIRKEGFESNLRSRDGVCLLELDLHGKLRSPRLQYLS